MATKDTDRSQLPAVVEKLDQFLQEQNMSSNKTDEPNINHLERKDSNDAAILSDSQKEEKLNRFLKNRDRTRGRKRRRKVTVSDVRTEAAKILEEFLQSQLQERSIQTKSPEKYQRYVEVNVTEDTSPTGLSTGTGYLTSQNNLLREDSIPYADDSDGDRNLKRADSLPHDEFVDPYQGIEIHHGKSKSAPYRHDNVIHSDSYRPKLNKGSIIPPPPPGTPHTPSEESLGRVHPVPYASSSKHTDSSVRWSTDSLDDRPSPRRRGSPPKRPSPPKAPDSLDLPSQNSNYHSNDKLHNNTDHYSSTPISEQSHPSSGSRSSKSSSSPSKSFSIMRRLQRKPSSSGTGSEGDSHYVSEFQGRKKKSMLKKAQERVSSVFRMRKTKPGVDDDETEEYSNRQSVITKSKHKKKHHKKDKEDHISNHKYNDKHKHNDMDEADMFEPYSEVVEDRHIHRNRHIHQTHTGDGGRTVLRCEDSTEVVDVVSDSEKKHIEKRYRVKESTDGGGIMGKLRRFTTRDKGKRMKGSKSAHEAGDLPDTEDSPRQQYSRAVSVPGHGHIGEDVPDNAGSLLRLDSRGGYSITNVDRSHHGNRTETHAIQVVSQDDIKRHSSHVDILDYTGAMIDRVYYDPDADPNLPRNKSFDLDQEACIHERHVRDRDGHIRIIRDTDNHSHIEMDGGDDESMPLSDRNETEKDDLYEKIAGRLAEIGDNLQTERVTSRRTSATTPQACKLDEAAGEPSPDDQMKKVVLSQLEMEIRDELRQVAADIDERLASNARQAALQIAGLVTYNTFKTAVQDTVGKEVGWAQLAAVFNITKRAIQVAGASGALASQIKEVSLKYIEDKFAHWIVGQGGWDSMLSESETDSELD